MLRRSCDVDGLVCVFSSEVNRVIMKRVALGSKFIIPLSLLYSVSLPNSEVFDFEARSMYQLSLQVSDNSATAPQQSQVQDVIITIGNMDDEPTIFNQTEYCEWNLNSGNSS